MVRGLFEENPPNSGGVFLLVLIFDEVLVMFPSFHSFPCLSLTQCRHGFQKATVFKPTCDMCFLGNNTKAS